MKSTRIELSDDIQECIDRIASEHAADMLAMGISPTSHKLDGSIGANTQGVIRYALMVLCREIAPD